MPPRASSAAQFLDDNLAQQVIRSASLNTCLALALTCRRFCKLVRSTRPVQLTFDDQDAQQLAAMPADRAYQQVELLQFVGGAEDEVQGVPNWLRLCSVMTDAVQRWPEAECITINPGWTASHYNLQNGLLLGALVPLQKATGMTSLFLHNVVDDYSLMYVPQLTQLTFLHLEPASIDSASLVFGPLLQAPLAAMTSLQTLQMEAGFGLCHRAGVAEEDLPLALPPNITYLEAAVPRCGPGMFWRHVAACTNLVSLDLNIQGGYFENDAAGHPSWMLYHVASSLVHLEELYIDGDSYRQPAFYTHLPEVLELLAGTQAAQQQQEEQGWDWRQLPVPPLAQEPADYNTVVVPPPNMGRLTALQGVRVHYCWPLDNTPYSSGWWLQCGGPHHWHALAGCSALKDVEGLHVSQPPPAGVKLPCVTKLQALLSTSPAATMDVLAAFPALQDLNLQLALRDEVEARTLHQAVQELQAVQLQPQQEPPPQQQQQQAQQQQQPQQQQQQQQQQQEVVLHHLTQVRISLQDTPAPLRPYFAALWPALLPVQRLELSWPPHIHLLPQLPSLSALPALTRVDLSSWVWQGNRCNVQRVAAEAVVGILQGASKLQKVHLMFIFSEQSSSTMAEQCHRSDADGASTNSSSSSSTRSRWDQLLLGLQATLPALRHVELWEEASSHPDGQAEPLAPTTLAALRPGLQVVRFPRQQV